MSPEMQSLPSSIKDLFQNLSDHEVLQKELGKDLQYFSNGHFFDILAKLEQTELTFKNQEIFDENKMMIKEILQSIYDDTFTDVDEEVLGMSVDIIIEIYTTECANSENLNNLVQKNNANIESVMLGKEDAPNSETDNRQNDDDFLSDLVEPDEYEIPVNESAIEENKLDEDGVLDISAIYDDIDCDNLPDIEMPQEEKEAALINEIFDDIFEKSNKNNKIEIENENNIVDLSNVCELYENERCLPDIIDVKENSEIISLSELENNVVINELVQSSESSLSEKITDEIKVNMANMAANISKKAPVYGAVVSKVKNILSSSLNYLKNDFLVKISDEKTKRIEELKQNLSATEKDLSTSKVNIGDLKTSIIANWQDFLSTDKASLELNDFITKLETNYEFLQQMIEDKNNIQAEFLEQLTGARQNLILAVRAYLNDDIGEYIATESVIANVKQTIIDFNKAINFAQTIIPELSEAYTYEPETFLKELSQIKQQCLVITIEDYEVLSTIETAINEIRAESRLILEDLRLVKENTKQIDYKLPETK